MTRLKTILTYLFRTFFGVRRPDFVCPKIRGRTDGTRCYEVVEDYTVRVRLLGYDVEITVLAGTWTDGASVPRSLWGVCGAPMDPPRVAAAVVHDWLYSAQALSRADADWIYAQIQAQAGIAYWRILIEYLALRLFGRSHWDDAAKCDTDANAETGRIIYLTSRD